MANTAYIYSFSDLGLSGLPVAGTTYTTDPGLTPDILTVSDGVGDTMFDAIAFPGGGFPVFDLDQVLASDLYVDGSLAGSTGDFVFTNSDSSTILLAGSPPITGYLVFVLPVGAPLGTTPTPVGFVGTEPVPPGASYLFTGLLGPGSVPYAALANCFTLDTLIECENGPKAVQEIVEGDLVVTRDNGLQAVRWVGRQAVAGLGDMAPVRFKAGVLGNTEDLLVSPMHRMVVSGARAEALFGEADVLVHASHLCDGDRIFREPVADISYFHLLFGRHEIINAYGCWSESFAPSAAALNGVEDATRAEILKLFPQLDATWQDAFPTLSAAEAAIVL
jgi:hypothetical protein